MSKLIVFLVYCSAFTLLSTSAANIVCYFASWAINRPGNGTFSAADIDPNLCTHIIYAFVGLREDGNVLVSDDWELIGSDEMNNLVSLKQQNPSLKIIVSMGGRNEGSYKYSLVARNAATRETMVQSVLDFIHEYNLDGFDLFWEYPCQRGGANADKANFVTLLGELKSALNAEGLILSAAVSGRISFCKLSYDIPAVVENLDMINLLTYDYHGDFEPFVGHYAPLYASSLDQTDEQKTLNVDAGLQYWLDQGAPASKINLGVGTYGHGFNLSNKNNTSLYANIFGGIKPSPYTDERGVIGYNEICEFYSGAVYNWDDEQQVPHNVSEFQWIGYDDIRSMQIKVEYANSKSLGGMMVWSLDTDDFHNICGEGVFPLINAIKQNLK